MTKGYKSHLIPKNNSKGFRIIHEFEDVDKHKQTLLRLRKYYQDNQISSRNSQRVSLRNTVHGYPYGNPNMVDLTKRFLKKDKDKTKRILTSFDLTNFYHFIDKRMIEKSAFPELVEDLSPAFVEIGNGIEVLAQGSPLSQDISNICLLETDLRAMSTLSHINTWTKRPVMMTSGILRYSPKVYLPNDFPIANRSDIPSLSGLQETLIARACGVDGSIELENIYKNSDILSVLNIRYMRYVDNIFLIVDAVSEMSDQTLERVSSYITQNIRALFLKAGFSINNLKNSKTTSMTNRRMPVLGLNVSDRVKCKRHYLDGIRAGIFNFCKNPVGDLPQSLVSSAIFSLYVDPRSHNRFRKCTKMLMEMNLDNYPNAKSLINFISKENKLTNDIPISY